MFLPLPIFFSLLGSAFCVWIASGNAFELCVSVGCTLFQDMTIYGISMWYIGFAAFACLLIFSITGRVHLGRLCTSAILFADIILLGIMIFVAPCTNCLIVAMLFACCYVAFRYGEDNGHIHKSKLLMLWLVLFIANTGFMLKAESDNWIIYGNENANAKMYFAPSCTSCREGVVSLGDNPNIAFLPVNNDESDMHIIALMTEYIKEGKNIKEALNMAFLVKKEDYKWDYFSWDTFLLYFRLMKNKAHVIESSNGAIPYFEFKGLPKVFVANIDDKDSALEFKNDNSNQNANENANINENPDYDVPIDLDIAGSCGEKNVEPCP